MNWYMLPIVDRLPTVSCEVILRSKSRKDMEREISRLQNILSRDDLILVYEIGLRPDKPVPVARHFAEVQIRIRGASDADITESISPWWAITTGRKKATMMID